eukprot:14549-Heterococcus_DN1.PRE.1
MAAFDETIFNLLPRETVAVKKPKRHVSTFDNSRQGSSYSGGGFYGLRDTKAHTPNAYLKRGTGTVAQTTPRRGDVRPASGTQRKAGVPTATERPVMGIKADKNFITTNAVNAILSVPQTKKAAPLDYLAKEDYGKVPAYLSHIKNEIQAETAMID